MAYIIPDEDLLVKSEKRALSYAELAALKQRALAGDASAAIALAQLPQPEQRLAGMLVKHFGGQPVTKAAKAKKPKKKAVKGARAQIGKRDPSSGIEAARLRFEAAHWSSLAISPDPALRETARRMLGLP